jgi:hypothetical protein
MNPELIPKAMNSIGLIFDIAGAWFVAWEVVMRFKGKQYGTSVTVEIIALPPNKTPEYEKYELNKYRKMWVGLVLLTIGFLFQIGSNWIYLPYNVNTLENTKAIHETNKPIKPIVTKTGDSKTPAIVVTKPKTTPDK